MINNEKDVAIFTNPIAEPPTNARITRAKYFKIEASSGNYRQFINTINAYILANMPLAHIANAGDFLGDKVERGEVDAPIQEGWQEKAGEIAQNENKTSAWHNREEVVSLTQRLAFSSINGSKLVTTTQGLAINQNTGEQTLNVVEGISVTNSALENNPYLQPLSDLKKAA